MAEEYHNGELGGGWRLLLTRIDPGSIAETVIREFSFREMDVDYHEGTIKVEGAKVLVSDDTPADGPEYEVVVPHG